MSPLQLSETGSPLPPAPAAGAHWPVLMCCVCIDQKHLVPGRPVLRCWQRKAGGDWDVFWPSGSEGRTLELDPREGARLFACHMCCMRQRIAGGWALEPRWRRVARRTEVWAESLLCLGTYGSHCLGMLGPIVLLMSVCPRCPRCRHPLASLAVTTLGAFVHWGNFRTCP